MVIQMPSAQDLPATGTFPLVTRPRSSRRAIPGASHDLICRVAVLATDVVAFAGARIGASAVASALNHFGPPFLSSSYDFLLWSDLLTQQATVSAILFVGVLVYLSSCNHYTEKLPFWNEARQVAATSLFALLIAALIETSVHGYASRQVLFGTWILFPFLVVGLRQIVKNRLNRMGLWQLPVLVIGDQRGQDCVVDVLGSETLPGYRVTRFMSSDDAEAFSMDGWRSYLAESGTRRIAIAASMSSERDSRLIQSVIRQQIPFFIIPQMTALPVVGCEVVPFFSHDTVMLSYRNNLAQPLARIAKALLDVSLSALLLLMLLPVMLLIAFLVRRDGGPAIFSHERIGANGVPFDCLKFRTMVTDASARLRDALAHDPELAEEWAQNQKLRVDPRITAIGQFLRRTSLDELPQLINVLRLEMSLVGPRPIVQDEVKRYEQDIAFYYETRPGLTGLWQVSGRSETSFAQRVRLDSWYVKNWTIWHDIAILAKTILVVLKRQGAR